VDTEDGVYLNVRMLMTMNKPTEYKIHKAVDVFTWGSETRWRS